MVEAERIEDGCSYYQFPVYDHRGTVHKLVDRSGETVGNYVYNAFGEILDQTNPPEGNRFKYQTNWMALKDDLYLSPSRVYSGDLGRFLQKDPLPKVRERGKLGIYENSILAEEMLRVIRISGRYAYSYTSNNPQNGVDCFGLVVKCYCEIGKFLKKYAPSFLYSYEGMHTYGHASFNRNEVGLRREIIRAMLSSKHVFTIKGKTKDEIIENFKKHVETREEIIKFAQAKKYNFGAGEKSMLYSAGNVHETINYRINPLEFFNAINNSKTRIACKFATGLTYAAAQGHWNTRWRSLYNNDWIPGDWGYIDNQAQSNNPRNWKLGLEGENIIYFGQYKFWGHIITRQTVNTLKWWKRLIEKWEGKNKREHGIPNVDSDVQFPIVGLE